MCLSMLATYSLRISPMRGPHFNHLISELMIIETDIL